MPYDIFISYSRRDNAQGRITELVERIKTDFAAFAHRDLVPFFDKHEIQGMEDWRQRLWQGLRESRLLLACLSPSYLQSKNCEWEFIEYLKYEIGHLHGFNGVAPIYFVEVPGWTGAGFEQQCAAWVAELRRRQHFDLRPWFHVGEDALHDTAVQERMGRLKHQIFTAITRGERAEKSLGNVDAHNPHFIGRTDILRMLRYNFAKPSHIGVVTAVNGIGGLGKTALATEYAHAFADDYGGGRWLVRCEGKDDLRLALAELATPLGFEFTEDEKKSADLQLERTRRELKKLAATRPPHRCLLLLDNVDRPALLDPAQVARLNGGDWLHVLATTRLGENELHGLHRDRSFLAIDELPADDALALIESYQPDGRFRNDTELEASREIVRLLGSFTLAVESAAVYLGQFANDVTCVAFLARLKKEGLVGLDDAAGQSSEAVLHGEKRLTATLLPTLDRLAPPERLALGFAALLPPDHVPLPWLRSLVAKTFPEFECDAAPGYPDPWKNILRRLFSLRLLQATDIVGPEGQLCVVRIHRLVGACAKRQIVESAKARESDGRNDRFRRPIVSVVAERCAFLEEGWMYSENRWEISPLHQLALLMLNQGDPAAVSVGIAVANRLQDIGDLRAARDLLQACQTFIARCGQSSDRTRAIVFSNTASIEEALGNYSRAKELFEMAKGIWEGITPWDYRALGQVSSNLAMVEMLLHNHDPAIRLAREGVFWLQRGLEPNAPDLATAYCNLATLEKDAGNYDEAREVFGMALSIWSETLPQFHPQFGIIHCNLARLEEDLGNLEAARQHLEQAIAVENRVLPESHPERAATLFILARVERKLGRPSVARKILEEVLRIEEPAFAPGSAKLAATYSQMANVLVDCEATDEANTLLLRVLAAEESQNGPDHPCVVKRYHELATIARRQGRKLDAQGFLRRIVESIQRTSGPEFESLMAPLTMLGADARDDRRFDEARELLARATHIGEVSSSDDYEQRVMSHLLLGSVQASLKQRPGAVEQFRRAHRLASEHLSLDHPLRVKATETIQQLDRQG